MSIYKNIGNWISQQLPDAEVCHAPYEGPRSEGYVTFQIIVNDQELWAKRAERVLNGDMIDETLSYETSIMVSINAYSPDGAMWISRLMASRQFESAIITLMENGYDLAISDVPQSPRNLTALGTEGYRERWQGDFTLNYTVKHTHQIYQLKEIITGGKWDDLELENKLVQ
ncbi:tail-completion protein [Vibrio phage 1.123.O._10N.286.48.F3]|nr:tail-completion protein [Vibrio phage 1.123.O._10N.286.48.F3]